MIGLVSGIEALTSAVAGPGGTTSTSSVRASFPVGGPAAAPSDFGQMLAQVASEAVNSLKAGEQAAISGVQGKASVQQVVEALMSAERSLQTAIAVRDKVTSAYLEISRMAI
jgi:flagellar hook-basal body complex protein FliE